MARTEMARTEDDLHDQLPDHVRDHLVGFYATERFLVRCVVGALAPGLAAGEGAMIIATPVHRARFEEAFERRRVRDGLPLDRLRMLDVDATRRAVVVDGEPDPSRFVSVIEATMDEVTPPDGRVQIFGEMVGALWDEGQVGAALAIEDLWNQLAATRPFSLFCGYPLDVFDGEDSAAEFLEVCRRHSAVTNESYDDPWAPDSDTDGAIDPAGDPFVVLQRPPA